jgi:hypothetical protein
VVLWESVVLHVRMQVHRRQLFYERRLLPRSMTHRPQGLDSPPEISADMKCAQSSLAEALDPGALTVSTLVLDSREVTISKHVSIVRSVLIAKREEIGVSMRPGVCHTGKQSPAPAQRQNRKVNQHSLAFGDAGGALYSDRLFSPRN